MDPDGLADVSSLTSPSSLTSSLSSPPSRAASSRAASLPLRAPGPTALRSSASLTSPPAAHPTPRAWPDSDSLSSPNLSATYSAAPVAAPDLPLSTIASAFAQSAPSSLTGISESSSPLSALPPLPPSHPLPSTDSSMSSDDSHAGSPREDTPPPPTSKTIKVAPGSKRKSVHTPTHPADTKKAKTQPNPEADQSIDADTSTGTAARVSGRTSTAKGRAAYHRARTQQAKVMAASPLPAVVGNAAEGQNTPETPPHSLGPCHQHRRFCGRPMLQCTNMRDKNQRCRLRFCDYALKVYYGLSREDIITRGRDAKAGDPEKVQLGLETGKQCPPSEAGYLFVCPRCTGTCDCSVCRHRRNLPPLAHTDEGHDLLAHAHARHAEQEDQEEETGSPDSPAVPTKVSGKGLSKGKVKPKPKGRASAQSGTSKSTKAKSTGAKGKAKGKATGAEPASPERGSDTSDDEALAVKMSRPAVATKRKSLSKAQKEAAVQDAQEEDELSDVGENGEAASDSDEPLSKPAAKGKATKNGTTAKAKAGAKKVTKGKAVTAKGTKATATKAKSSATKGKAAPKGKAASAKGAKATSAKGGKSAAKDAPKVRPKPVVPAPEPQEPPLTGVVGSPLPTANLFARMWIYEALVRFDAVPTPGPILRRLDKFDDWNPRMLNQILEAVTACLAGTSIKALQTSAKPSFTGTLPGAMPLVRAVRMLHNQPDASLRGEAWEAAREWLQSEQVAIEDLPDVEHNFVETAEDRMDTPVSDAALMPGTSRRVLTRAGRAKLNNVDVPRKNLREASYHSDDDLEEDVEDDDKDFDSTQYPEASEDEKDEDMSEPTSRPRRGRISRNSKEASSVADQTKLRRSSRARRAPPQPEAASRAQSVTVSASRQNSAMPGSDRASVAPEGSTNPADVGAHTPTPPPTAPVPAPPFEQRVAILGALVNDMVPRTNAVRADLIEAWNNVPASERDARNDLNKFKADHKEKLDALNEKLGKETNQRYIEELGRKKSREQRNLAWNLLRRKVQLHNHLNRTKLRTGPLGTDADGREYWQLTEYTDSMPKNTDGRWAWALYIYGKPFPHPTTITELTTPRSEGGIEQHGEPNGTASESDAEAKANGTSPKSDVGGKEDNPAENETADKSPKTEDTTDVVMAEANEAASQSKSPEAQTWAQEKFVLEQQPRWQMVNWPYWIFKTIQYIKYRLAAVEADEKRTRELHKWQRAVIKAENEAIAAAPSKKSKTRASFSAAGVPSLAPGEGPRWAASVAAGIVSGSEETHDSKTDALSDLSTDELSTPEAQSKVDALEEVARLTEPVYEEKRKTRRAQVEELCQRLDKVLEYFMLHLGFVERSEVESLS